MIEQSDTAVALNRRELLQGMAAAAAASGLASPAASQVARQPNILFILADDLGFADLSCYGRRDYRTPVIDRLAADGLIFEQAYANSAICSPTRVALITGRYQQRLPVGLPEPITPRDRDKGLPAGMPTLPSQLRAAGYHTSLVGKWHMGWPPKFGPLRFGYDRFFGIIPGAADHISHRLHTAEGTENALYEGDREAAALGYMTDLLAQRAVGEIRAFAGSDKPFFLSLHFTAPHWPWQRPNDPPLSEEKPVPGAPNRLRHEDGGSLETYAEMMRSMDSAIARVLAELDSRTGTRETIVVFTSDNGGERFSDTWPLRGAKGELLEGGIRVPQIVRWPGRIAAGRRTDQVMVSMDWLPTLLAAAGVRPNPAFAPDGADLLNVITGASPPRPRTLFWRMNGKAQAAARDGDWKYLRIDDEEWLFDVRQDPRERANRKDREKPIFERLKREFAAWEKTMLPYPPSPASSPPTSPPTGTTKATAKGERG